MVDFICSDDKKIVITTNKIATLSDLNIIEKYIKELNNVNLSDIISLRLPQSKSYLKILGILYFVDDTNLSVMLDIIKWVIKTTHLFKDTVLASCLHVIKALLKSNMAIV